jgi:outer membrane protein assembly factor BamB
MRTGQNLTETSLTQTNVAATTFGLLRTLKVDGLVDAQPLYLSALTVGGATHNVAFVATEHDSVYAFDADTGTQLWKVSLIGSGESVSDDHGCLQIAPEIGVTATPAIDRSAGAHGTIYLVATTKDASGKYHLRLHALDVTTGAEASASPTELTATFRSTSFDPEQYAERAAILLANKTLYVSFTSHCDAGPYGGWVMSLSQSSLALTSAINLANGASGTGFASQGPSIWMAGGGPAADAEGNVYVLTANGKFDALDPGGFPTYGDYGNSFVKMSSGAAGLSVSDYFTMSDEVTESQNDLDLGSGGIMLLPDQTDSSGKVQHLAVGAGKDGNLYVVNRDNMGKFKATSNAIWQQLEGALPGGVWSTPAYYNSNIYYGPVESQLLMYPIADAKVAANPSSRSPSKFGYPGAFPVISANGASNGIVWALEDASPAVLHAYSATDLAKELYNSNQAAGGRDHFGDGNKYIVPVVADGKVFAASSTGVAIFGLLH